MFEDQDVVVTGLEQRALEVVRLREGDPPEVATAQHLALTFDVKSGQQLTHPFEILDRPYRFTDAMIE